MRHCGAAATTRPSVVMPHDTFQATNRTADAAVRAMHGEGRGERPYSARDQ